MSYKHHFKCGCSHLTKLKRDLSHYCVMHDSPAIMLVTEKGGVTTLSSLVKDKGIKELCGEGRRR